MQVLLLLVLLLLWRNSGRRSRGRFSFFFLFLFVLVSVRRSLVPSDRVPRLAGLARRGGDIVGGIIMVDIRG